MEPTYRLLVLVDLKVTFVADHVFLELVVEVLRLHLHSLLRKRLLHGQLTQSAAVLVRKYLRNMTSHS